MISGIGNSIGFKGDLNLYAYVGNDPLDKTDPNGTSCQKAQGGDGYTCKVDHPNTPTGLTPKQQTQYKDQITAYETRYTVAVNKLAAHPNKPTKVAIAGEKAFTVKASDVLSRLIRAEVTATPGTPGGGASPTGGNIVLYDGILGRGGVRPQDLSSFQEYGTVHEGIHWTGFGPLPDGTRSATGERSVFNPWDLGGARPWIRRIRRPTTSLRRSCSSRE